MEWMNEGWISTRKNEGSACGAEAIPSSTPIQYDHSKVLTVQLVMGYVDYYPMSFVGSEDTYGSQ